MKVDAYVCLLFSKCTSLFLFFTLLSCGVFSQSMKNEKDNVYDTIWLSKPHLLYNVDGAPCYILKDKKAAILSPAAASTESKVQLNGTISYEFLYRSRVDSPFKQSDFQQHTIRANIRTNLINRYPVSVNLAYRMSNSPYFKDYLDVNVGFDPGIFRKNIYSAVAENLEQKLQNHYQLGPLQSLYQQQLNASLEAQRNLTNPEFIQLQEQRLQRVKEDLLDAFNEIDRFTNIENIESYLTAYLEGHLTENELSNIIAKGNAISKNSVDSVLKDKSKEIAALNESLDQSKKVISNTKSLYDSISKIKNIIRDSISKMKAEISALKNGSELRKWSKKHQQSDTLTHSGFLMSLTSFNVGRNIINYSYLTVNNVSIIGLDAEFQPSQSAFRFSAGVVDYRFRDFIYAGIARPKQTVAVGRYGLIGKTGNSFYFTSYAGKREILSQTGNTTNQLFNSGGFAIEGRWLLNATNQLSVEVAKSTNPAYRSPAQSYKPVDGLIDLKQRSNEAYAIQYTGYITSTSTRINLNYRKFGTDFQSFSVYTYNANQSSWSAMLDQQFWHRMLSIKMGIKKNEYVYPTLQDLSSNAIFKTAQLTFFKRKWPSITAGYYPATQVVVMPDKQLSAVTYHTLSLNSSYQYKFFGLQANTIALYSKFYNSSSDTNFIYYNTTYLSLQHLIWLKAFTIQGGYTYSKQQLNRLQTFEASVSWKSRNGIQLSGGLKGNTLSNQHLVITNNCALTIPVKGIGVFQGRYDRSFLPAWLQRQLIPVTIGQLLFTRNI